MFLDIRLFHYPPVTSHAHAFILFVIDLFTTKFVEMFN